MKEKDYIAATNLAKVRMATYVIAHIFVDGEITSRDKGAIEYILDKWTSRLEQRVDMT